MVKILHCHCLISDSVSNLVQITKEVSFTKPKMSTKIEFAVQMTCDGCVNAVKNVLAKESGIKSVDVDLQSKSVVVDTTLSTDEVHKLLESTGRKVVVKGYGGSQAGVAILEFGEKNVQGVVRFMQIDANTCIIDGTVDGLQPGKHGLAVHECGDTSKGKK